jgi:hypothetical protein
VLYKDVKNKTCETRSCTLREEHRIRAFENRVLKGTFEPKRDEATGGCRKLDNEELHNLHCCPDVERDITPKQDETG